MSDASELTHYEVLVIGSGPAGHKAAVQAAHVGRKTLLIEREIGVGGACVHRGTIPSKTLRETAVSVAKFKRRSGGVFDVRITGALQVASLMTRMEQVVNAHTTSMREELDRQGVEQVHGRARFVTPREVDITSVKSGTRRVYADTIVIATGSRPRSPPGVPVDHENILDSDSILSMIYLPTTLVVLGAGVIACEYASIFAALGVRVVMVDKGERPLAFMDRELTDRFLEVFEGMGGKFLGGQRSKSVEWNGVSAVVTTLEDGTVIESDKCLCALGRIANLDGLCIEAAGLRRDERGLLGVNENLQTAVAHIYGVGDVIGPPSLASTSADQGRRAVCHALGLPSGVAPEMIPVGIYTIPEMSAVGLTGTQATERCGGARIGRARFESLARGQIVASGNGMLKMVADAAGRKLLGVQIIGEAASELIHLGQMALVNGCDVDVFVENTFNFPTLSEAYRVAALDIVWQRQAGTPSGTVT